MKKNEIIDINTCFKYKEVFNSSVHVVDLGDSDHKVFCSTIETDFVNDTAMILESKSSNKAALLSVRDTWRSQVI